ncbi:DUF2076 domain-containing protein [Rhodoligotrophos defluvii]|uniref:DUF2076 domain-containing protein n=1 Tax=Rhodoligotrophos defluvii TaxID=2561934 RepID=UPI0010C9A5B6|nr:DUF2076 domain-containing protein [Rhodoligotrophos defluvii]
MDNQDRTAIEDLFRRLAAVEQQAGPRDAEAQGLIDNLVRQQPAAPYYMAQTIVMQTYALEDAERRIEDLERRLADTRAAAPSGGFLSGLFGGGRGAGSVPSVGRGPQPGASYGTMPPQAPLAQGAPRGGGFLAGAAQTAMGVAGGVLLGNAIAGMFGSNPAQAAPASQASQEASSRNEPAQDESAQDASADADQDEEGGGFFDSFFGSDEEI